MTFRARLSLFFVAALGVTTVASYGINARTTQQRLLDEFVERSETFAESIAAERSGSEGDRRRRRPGASPEGIRCRYYGSNLFVERGPMKPYLLSLR